jgi:hypothetical protein
VQILPRHWLGLVPKLSPSELLQGVILCILILLVSITCTENSENE